MTGHTRELGRMRRRLTPFLAAVVMGAAVVAGTALPAQANLPIKAYACGYFTNIKFGTGSYGRQGCSPQTDAGATANSAAPSSDLPQSGGTVYNQDPDGAKAIYQGVATVFSSPYDPNDVLTNSGAMSAVVQGGPTAVTATAHADTVGPSPFWTRSPGAAAPYAEPAKSGSTWDGSTGYVESRCTATGPTSKSGNLTIKNGYVDTHLVASGPMAGYPTETVAVPNPTPLNYRVDFTIDNVGDHGYLIFNERIQNSDGSLTVNGAHMYMQGPTAIGDMIIAQVTCGVA